MANGAAGGERIGTGSDIAVRGISADVGDEEKTWSSDIICLSPERLAGSWVGIVVSVTAGVGPTKRT
jgi:hypothetical protein